MRSGVRYQSSSSLLRLHQPDDSPRLVLEDVRLGRRGDARRAPRPLGGRSTPAGRSTAATLPTPSSIVGIRSGSPSGDRDATGGRAHRSRLSFQGSRRGARRSIGCRCRRALPQDLGNPFFVTEILARRHVDTEHHRRAVLFPHGTHSTARAQGGCWTPCGHPVPTEPCCSLRSSRRESTHLADASDAHADRRSRPGRLPAELARLAVDGSIEPVRRMALHRRRSPLYGRHRAETSTWPASRSTRTRPSTPMLSSVRAGVAITLPEYTAGARRTGALKNAIDWASRAGRPPALGSLRGYLTDRGRRVGVERAIACTGPRAAVDEQSPAIVSSVLCALQISQRAPRGSPRRAPRNPAPRPELAASYANMPFSAERPSSAKSAS